MELTQEQNKRIQQFFKDKWKNGCSKCGENSFSLEKSLYGLAKIEEEKIDSNSEIVAAPLLVVLCENCGDLSLLSSKFLGITE